MNDTNSTQETNAAESILNRYIEAANRHDMNALRGLFAEDVVWYLGSDKLMGVEEILHPLMFDAGANTVLYVHNSRVCGDSIEFELVEQNDVLEALGIPGLHHFVRFEIGRNGQIQKMTPIRPPTEQEAFVAQVTAFMDWLKECRSEAFDRLWPAGKFEYSRATGEEMPKLVTEWKQRTISE